MTHPALPVPGPAEPTRPLLDAVFGDLWPERDLPASPRTVGTAAAVGLLAAIVLPDRDIGLGAFLVLVAVGTCVVTTRRQVRSSYDVSALALCALLLTPVLLRDAAWIAVLCVLASGALASATLVRARTVEGLVVSPTMVPLAALRGLPWLGRSLTAPARVAAVAPAVRTAAVSLALVLAVGALFVSADALFASWVDAVIPDLTLGSAGLRAFVLVAVGGIALAGRYVALNPPDVERLALPTPAPAGRRYEWLVPLALVAGLFAAFVAAQLAVMFGGHAYLRRTTGLTYADYVHQGFGQLTVATALALGVVTLVARRIDRGDARSRLQFRLAGGALCALTLVVVASALFRMHVYEEAYGFTRLRLLVSVFEGWLGLVLLGVIAAGLRLRGGWVPRAAVATGAAALLALATVNPDGYIADRNVDRYLETGKADWAYLAGLSADAVPALQRLPADVRRCALATSASGDGRDWLEWNLGRARAGAVSPDPGAGCADAQ